MNGSYVDSYAIGLAIILFLTLICSALCYKNMGVNRGNFINLPAWRKSVKAVLSLILYVLLGVFLWREKMEIVLCAVFSIIVILVLYWCRPVFLKIGQQHKERSWKSTKSILSKSGIPEYHFVLNRTMLEYIFYAVSWTAKALIAVIAGLLCGWQVVNCIWAEGIKIQINVEKCIVAPMKSCLYACFIIALISTVIFFILIVIDEQLVRTSEDGAKIEREKWEIRRRFQFREHDV